MFTTPNDELTEGSSIIPLNLTGNVSENPLVSAEKTGKGIGEMVIGDNVREPSAASRVLLRELIG